MTEGTDGGKGSLILGALEVDLDGYRASLAGRTLSLSASQLEVLAFLLVNHQRVVSREELSKAIGLRRGRSVDVILWTLRKQLGPGAIRNVRNRGWVLVSELLRV